MKIYIAALYERRFALQAFAQSLKDLGHEITARWLDNKEASAKDLTEAALMDVGDVLKADTLIFISDPTGSKNRGGGRWFEFGLAYSQGKRLIAILDTTGDQTSRYYPHDSVFTALPEVTQFNSQQEFLDYLSLQVTHGECQTNPTSATTTNNNSSQETPSGEVPLTDGVSLSSLQEEVG